jgi:hypothetical protein
LGSVGAGTLMPAGCHASCRAPTTKNFARCMTQSAKSARRLSRFSVTCARPGPTVPWSS